MPNDASAPSDTRVFMFGPPALSDRQPSTKVSRPGPSSEHGEPRGIEAPYKTLSYLPLEDETRARVSNQHAAASAHATTTRRVLMMRTQPPLRFGLPRNGRLTPATASRTPSANS